MNNEEIKKLIDFLEDGFAVGEKEVVPSLQELLRLREEAKLGNIPYKEAIALKERNKVLEEFVDELREYVGKKDYEKATARIEELEAELKECKQIAHKLGKHKVQTALNNKEEL